MSFRSVPRTIPELLAYVEERLRRTQTDLATTTVVIDHGGLAGLNDDDHDQYQLDAEKGQAEGYAGLDAGARVPKAQLPGDVVYTADLPDTEAAELLAWLALTEA